MTRSPKLDEFAELISEGLTTREAAERMGVPARRGERYLEDIRKRLGSQAI